jgi:D-glycerate 3-kinase
MITPALQSFISRHRLPESYLSMAEKWFSPILSEFGEHYGREKSIQIIGINGCQGSGKSTLADYLCTQVKLQYGAATVSLSLDDFYLTKAERTALAHDVHPLLAVRGVPGTHDIALAIDTVNSLKAGKRTLLTRFDKSTDDRTKAEDSVIMNGPIGLIVLEGWCFGATPESQEKLATPVNEALAGDYQSLFNMADRRVMLRAPSFDSVFKWRLEQEQKLAERLRLNIKDPLPSDIMDENDVRHFVNYFQRITEQCLTSMPEGIDYLYQLNENRAITRYDQLNSND